MKHNDLRARAHPSGLAFLLHRLSGVLLTLFLPLHFWTLGLALTSEAALDEALRWYDMPLFRLGEWALVFLLTVHALGGIRLLLIEFGPWRGLRLGWIGVSLAGASAATLAFLIASLN